jgi:hypothetical protein
MEKVLIQSRHGGVGLFILFFNHRMAFNCVPLLRNKICLQLKIDLTHYQLYELRTLKSMLASSICSS